MDLWKELKSLLPLWKTVIGALIVVELARVFGGYEGQAEDVGAWGAFFTAFGVIYAILAGFMLVEVLSRYGAIAQAIEDELNAVECLRDFLIYLEDRQPDACAGIQQSLATYVRSVAEEEWPLMTSPEGDVPSDTSPALYDLMRSCRRVEVEEDRDVPILRALMETLADVTRFRTRRLSLANSQLPPRLRFLVVFMSHVLVLGYALMYVSSDWVDRLMTVSLAVSVHLLYLIIDDLDHPFYGVWNMSRQALDELMARFRSESSSGPRSPRREG